MVESLVAAAPNDGLFTQKNTEAVEMADNAQLKMGRYSVEMHSAHSAHSAHSGHFLRSVECAQHMRGERTPNKLFEATAEPLYVQIFSDQ